MRRHFGFWPRCGTFDEMQTIGSFTKIFRIMFIIALNSCYKHERKGTICLYKLELELLICKDKIHF